MENLKDKDVIEGNKIIEWNFLIAKFMGWTYPHIEAFKRDIVFHESHNYDTRWDKLMPVVEKIGKDYEFMIDTYAGVEVSKKPMQSFLWIDRDESIPLIQQTWQAVVQFIQWYNTQPNSNSNE